MMAEKLHLGFRCRAEAMAQSRRDSSPRVSRAFRPSPPQRPGPCHYPPARVRALSKCRSGQLAGHISVALQTAAGKKKKHRNTDVSSLAEKNVYVPQGHELWQQAVASFVPETANAGGRLKRRVTD